MRPRPHRQRRCQPWRKHRAFQWRRCRLVRQRRHYRRPPFQRRHCRLGRRHQPWHRRQSISFTGIGAIVSVGRHGIRGGAIIRGAGRSVGGRGGATVRSAAGGIAGSAAIRRTGTRVSFGIRCAGFCSAGLSGGLRGSATFLRRTAGIRIRLTGGGLRGGPGALPFIAGGRWCRSVSLLHSISLRLLSLCTLSLCPLTLRITSLRIIAGGRGGRRGRSVIAGSIDGLIAGGAITGFVAAGVGVGIGLVSVHLRSVSASASGGNFGHTASGAGQGGHACIGSGSGIDINRHGRGTGGVRRGGAQARPGRRKRGSKDGGIAGHIAGGVVWRHQHFAVGVAAGSTGTSGAVTGATSAAPIRHWRVVIARSKAGVAGWRCIAGQRAILAGIASIAAGRHGRLIGLAIALSGACRRFSAGVGGLIAGGAARLRALRRSAIGASIGIACGTAAGVTGAVIGGGGGGGIARRGIARRRIACRHIAGCLRVVAATWHSWHSWRCRRRDCLARRPRRHRPSLAPSHC